jgi:hypothetical protein
MLEKRKKGKNSQLCQQHGPKQAVGKAVDPFANRTLPTAVASLLAKVTTS